MNLIDDELVKAEANSADARKQLAKTVVALQSRLKPSALAREAIEDLKQAADEAVRSGADTIRRNPVSTIGIVAALTALIARKPLARLLRGKPTDA